jgi:3-oxoacyl-[acyl-carrier protein] reductase
VIVTGGSRGIGAGIVSAFVKNGANVVYNGLDIHREAGEKLQRELNSLGLGSASFVSCDVSDSTSVDKLISNVVNKYGRLDCLGKS